MLVDVSLGGFWKFKGYQGCSGEELGAYKIQCSPEGWLNAEAPLTAHTNLMDNKLIPDPFKGCNEREVQWVIENEWWYRKEIDLDDELVAKEAIELFFGGLDTFATVWVNEVKSGEANNMFTPWRFDIKKVVKPGRNLIAIRFKPACKVAAELEQRYKHKYACLSAENFSARPYVRKAQYSFGWDWGPTLPTTGIWREAKIFAYNKARLGYVSGLPIEVTKETARIKLSAEIQSLGDFNLFLKFSLNGFGDNFEEVVVAKVSKGKNFADCLIEVNAPKLWWPRGYGEAALYNATVKLFSGQELLDEASVRVGIRSIELIQEPDEEGKTFIFRINGQKVFCKGANWIPADSFLPRVNFERYEKLLGLAADANFNMLRVWGGGVYEAEELYYLCDSLGIMIWQDFMYVCAGYPEEEWFLQEAEREATITILRLRGHPSIVVWCGNNENQWLYSTLWRKRDKVDRLYGSKIYDSLLLDVSKRLDSTRPYRPSSPFGGEDSNGRHEGDRHNWEVWSKGIDYTAYLKETGRFISEFGWQAPPTMDLLTAYLDKEDLDPNSYAFRAHEKQQAGLEILRALLAVHYPVSDDLRLFVHYSQLNQGEALKTAVNYWRTRMFRTSGCLIWQLDDCWPAISWSIIDYGPNPKAAYFFVKRAYQPIIVPLIIRNDSVEVYVVNETEKPLDSTLMFEIMTFSGEVLFEQTVQAKISEYTSLLLMKKALDGLPLRSNCILAATLESKGKIVCVDVKTVAEPKDLKFETPKIVIEYQINQTEFQISLTSNVYAKAVELKLNGLSAKFSDNFFDLIPMRQKIVECKTDKGISKEDFERLLVAQAYPYLEAATVNFNNKLKLV